MLHKVLHIKMDVSDFMAWVFMFDTIFSYIMQIVVSLLDS